MTLPRRLGVLFTPSSLEPAWRTALTHQAAQAGWQVIDAANAPVDFQTEGHVLILAQDAETLMTLGPYEQFVVADTPCAATTAAATEMGEAVNAHSRARASRGLASAAMLAAGGAPVLDARGSLLSLPDLGDVRRGDEIAGSPMLEDRPLAMYDVLPVPVGAHAEWGPDRFSYPLKDQYHGGSPVVDMTGRARALLFGPYIELTPGVWRADIRVSVDPEGGHAHLLLEWGSGARFLHCKAEITTPGLYGVALDREWTEQGPAEVRLWIPQPLFQGRLEFLGCRITRMPDDTPETAGPSPST